jgi:hypothetical protein
MYLNIDKKKKKKKIWLYENSFMNPNNVIEKTWYKILIFWDIPIPCHKQDFTINTTQFLIPNDNLYLTLIAKIDKKKLCFSYPNYLASLIR